jgi:hypothetical protein
MLPVLKNELPIMDGYATPEMRCGTAKANKISVEMHSVCRLDVQRILDAREHSCKSISRGPAASLLNLDLITDMIQRSHSYWDCQG